MQKTMLLAGTAFVAMSLSAGSQATCTIHEHWDYQGDNGAVQDNDYVRFAEKGSKEDRHLPARQNRTFWDPSWYNKVSSVEVSNGCRATFYMTPGNKAKGHVVFRESTPRFPEDINDKTHGVVCECS